jgi:hypothetical protein
MGNSMNVSISNIDMWSSGEYTLMIYIANPGGYTWKLTLKNGEFVACGCANSYEDALYWLGQQRLKHEKGVK